MDKKIWQFEGDWYIRLDDDTSLCMNSEIAAKSYLELKEQLARLKHITNLARIHICSSQDQKQYADWCDLRDALLDEMLY